MATTNDPGREQMLLAAGALLLERYGDGSSSLDPVRAMHAVALPPAVTCARAGSCLTSRPATFLSR
ncbi:hypothetical protein ACFT9I_18805 [Streptomyces sp. NPDC057137]|uniref:hypothetical protein n=1 Tax=Streptomyces sp. NPDC057137 TaxID=3346030 RepID=UPI003632AF14